MLIKFLISVLFLVSFSHFVSSHADSLNPGVLSKDSSPYGMQYSNWISKWWNWHISIPTQLHPRENYEPSKCTVNQEGEVWFLTDILSGKEERFCTIPHGKAILVPLLTGICWDDNTDPSLKTDEGLRRCAMEGDEGGILSASIDRLKLNNLQDYRVQTTPFNLTIPENNIVESQPGTYRAIADGFFVFLEPLSRGMHDLDLKTSVSNPVNPAYNYAAEVIYRLQVQ